MEGAELTKAIPAVHRPGVEPATSRSQVRRPNHYTTEPPGSNGREVHVRGKEERETECERKEGRGRGEDVEITVADASS